MRIRIPGFSGAQWTRRKIMIAILASIGILALTATTLAAIVMPLLVNAPGEVVPRPTAAAPTSTIPAVPIKPLAVRVVSSQPLQARPEDCPRDPPPAAPQEPVKACDVQRTGVYELGPVALRLNLIAATSARLPMSEFHTVQMAMDETSRAAFAQFTAANVGKQLAFVRDGLVLAAPTITQPIDGQSLQISGELNAATADTMTQMLRNGA